MTKTTQSNAMSTPRNITNLGLSSSIDQMNLNENYRESSQTPEFMIKIDGLLSSTIDGYTDHAPCFLLQNEISRFTNANAADQLYTSSRVVIEDPIIVIPNGVYVPTIQMKLVRGDAINEIKFVRLANINQTNVVQQEILYTSCYFQRAIPRGDVIWLTFRAKTFKNTIYCYDQDTGKNTGQQDVTVDVSTGTVV
ncbi:MAG: hypothetical protein ACK5O7_05595 [Holosporales bacterium]